MLGDRGTDRVDDLADVGLTDQAAVYLLHDDELFVGTRFRCDREARPAATQQSWVTVLNVRLDVFGVVVAPADDDQVLQPPRDEQFVVESEAKVARPQERSAPVREERLKRLLGLFGPAPVARRDAASGEPDLADLAGSAR